MKDMTDTLENSIRKVEKWVEDHDYRGYEPFDGLSSVFRPLTAGSLFADRLLMQLIRQSPVNLRPVFGVKPLDSTIGRGYMAAGHIAMARLTGDKRQIEKAVSCLAWLMENKSPAYADYSWGKHFDFASRGGRYPKFEPITIWTSLIGLAFLDAYEVLQEKKYLDVADSVCNWIVALPRTVTETGVCINYTALQHGDCTIHNQSMMGAAMLARTAKFTGNAGYMRLAKQAMEYSCARQLPDGGWYYGEDPMYHWIDNFHTGYNLDSLKCYMECTGDSEFGQNLAKGFEFYIRHFFEESGRPRYYHTRTYPVDSQCAAQAIETMAGFSDRHPLALDMALKVAGWTIENMQDEKGYFYYRQYPLVKAKTPMLHWAQATTYKALAVLLSRLAGPKKEKRSTAS